MCSVQSDCLSRFIANPLLMKSLEEGVCARHETWVRIFVLSMCDYVYYISSSVVCVKSLHRTTRHYVLKEGSYLLTI